MAQVIPRKDAILVGLEGSAVPPNPNPWVAVTPATAHVAFQLALADLPATGGTLFVQPGSAPYVFGEAVNVDKPNVILRFAAGPRVGTETSYLTFPNSGGPKELFRVRAPRFRCHDGYVLYSADNDGGLGTSDDDRSCFLVTDELGNADDAAFLDCTFDMEQAAPLATSPNLSNFSCIRSSGRTDTNLIQGLRVSGTTFRIRPGTSQTQAWAHARPLGICCIRARNTAEVRVTKTMFLGTQDSPRGNGGPFVFLDNCPASILSDLVVRAIQTNCVQADPPGDYVPAGSIIRITTHGLQEGHRTVLARLAFEVVNARYMVELLEGRHDVIAFANWGRLLPECEAVLYLGGVESRGLAASAMNFHNFQAGQTPSQESRSIRLEASADVALWANVVLRFAEKNGFLSLDSDTCSNVVRGRQPGDAELLKRSGSSRYGNEQIPWSISRSTIRNSSGSRRGSAPPQMQGSRCTCSGARWHVSSATRTTRRTSSTRSSNRRPAGTWITNSAWPSTTVSRRTEGSSVAATSRRCTPLGSSWNGESARRPHRRWPSWPRMRHSITSTKGLERSGRGRIRSPRRTESIRSMRACQYRRSTR